MAGEIALTGQQGARGAITLGQLAFAMRRMPGAMWVAQADGVDRAFRGFWKTLKPRMEIKNGGTKYTLTSPRQWPITITTKPVPSFDNPDWSKFRARIGTDSTAALLLETGGRITPQNKRFLAIPVGGARTPGGKVRPYFTSPAKAKGRGKEFVAIRDRDGKVRLHELIKKKGGRGRPRKGVTPAKVEPAPEAAYILVTATRHRPRLNFHKTWRSDYANAQRRMSSNIARAVREVLAGKTPSVLYAKPKAVAA